MSNVKNGNARLIEIFKIMSFYDEYRWEFFKEDNLINFFKDKLDDDTKILTHWLCYIADRQMPFQRIWDIGGFVFSELIFEMKKQKDLNLLNPEYDDSFIKIDTKKRKDNKVRYTFISKSKMGKNEILDQNDYDDFIENERVKFKSRFLPSDYFSILFTFVILEDYDFSFSKFIKKVYFENKDKEDIIRRMLFSLYLLTYYDIKQRKSVDIENFTKNLTEAYKRKKKVNNILNDPNEFDTEYKRFINSIFKQKRAWCSLRDYIKNPSIKQFFKKALTDEDFKDEDFEKLSSLESCSQLELPGDVWNNNSEFRQCILKGTEYANNTNKKSKWSLNKILREFYDNNKQYITGYPEQFDISFNFVPKMCESYKQDNCKWCPVYKIDNEVNAFNKVCLKDKNMYCPIILAGCNYKVLCKGENDCKLINAI